MNGKVHEIAVQSLVFDSHKVKKKTNKNKTTNLHLMQNITNICVHLFNIIKYVTSKCLAENKAYNKKYNNIDEKTS